MLGHFSLVLMPGRPVTCIWPLAGVSPDAQKLLRASVGANATFNPPAGLPNPSLPGETTGNADVHGMINMSQVLIVAEPWIYNMTVTLPAFPLVRVSSSTHT